MGCLAFEQRGEPGTACERRYSEAFAARGRATEPQLPSNTSAALTCRLTSSAARVDLHGLLRFVPGGEAPP
jgi:hypothetical protein